MNSTVSAPGLRSFFAIFRQDIAFAIRQLRKSPGFAAVVIGSLALGIGASVAVFSVVRAVLLDPFPYKDASRMVHVELHEKSSDRYGYLVVNSTQFQDLQRLPLVDDVFIMDNRRQALTSDDLPVSVIAGYYSSNLFTYMGVPPLLGREFTAADAPGGNASPVVVLSYLFWKKQYGGRLDILGRQIQLDHVPYTVIGVASPRFTWGDSEVYIPGSFTADPHYYMEAFLKLKAGASHAAIAAELQPLLERYARQDPTHYPQNRKVVIQALGEEAMHGFKGPLLVLFAAVLLLLLIGCANVSILLLARGAARQQEFAVRASIGASRWRIARQLITESILLSLLGSAAGVLLAWKGVDWLADHMPEYSFPHEASIHVNTTVLLFAVAIALLTGVLFGLSPAWQLAHSDPAAIVQSGTRLAGTVRGRRTHRLLIAGQVMLTMILLAGAGAAMRAFVHLVHTPLGFDPDRVFLMEISTPKGGNRSWQALSAQEELYRQTAAAATGVASASISSSWTPPFSGYRGAIVVSTNPNLTDAQAALALVSEDIFSTLRVPLLQGRFFTPSEEASGAHVALVNRAFLRQFLPGRDPLAAAVRSPALRLDNPDLVSAANPDGWLQIVGVVDDARNDGLSRPVMPAVYLPATFVIPPNTVLVVRAQGDPEAAMRAVETSLHRLNRELIILPGERQLSQLLEIEAWGREKFLASLFGLFAVLALTLSAAGIYSVISYAVSQRTREFGVRMALGSPRAGVVRLVLQSSLLTVGVGAAIGLAVSLALGKVLATSDQATVRDPVMLLVACGVLFLTTALACLYPAWRAASIDPMQAIRTE